MKKDINKLAIIKSAIILLGASLSILGIVLFREEYLAWNNIPLLFILTLISMLGSGFLAAAYSLSFRMYSKKKTVIAAVLASSVFAVLQWGITFLINVIIGKEQLNVLAADTATFILLIYIWVLTAISLMSLVSKKTYKAAISLLTLIPFIIGSYTYIDSHVLDLIYKDFKAAIPVTGKEIQKAENIMVTADFYVSTKGSDANEGSKASPFLTIEKAITEVRKLDKTGKTSVTVAIEAGEYRVSSLKFTSEDSGTQECPVTYCAYGDGEVIFNGGITLSSSDFVSVKEYPETAARLTDDAKENVYVLDLTKAPYSLTAEDWGKLYAIGSYNTAANYDGDFVGPLYCELFVNDKRQTLARYPDEGFLMTEEVVSTGLGRESDGALTAVENWDEIRNPEPDVYKVNGELAKRIGNWKNLDEVWMFGYWKYDWADASSPIGRFEEDTGIISPKFVSAYGTKTDAPYYFFNVLEELSAEGEWYLDRKNGLLCLYSSEHLKDAQIDLSLSLESVIDAEADYLRFKGITVKGTRGDGITITGNGNTVENCLIKNVAGNAVIMTGYNNLICNCEITHTGKGGIILDGGDRATLSAGNNKADNNYIHDWSEIYLTYQPAVTLNGVGNICSHNEMVNSPHEAVTWAGNNHIIEYNLIHDVCLLSDDAGAIYSGRRWDWYGTVIRYNAIYNLGSGDHKPDGIYLDDALSGIEVYGNILVNIPKLGIHLGGGRDLEVWGNIIINAGEHPISYDARAREGALENGWFNHSAKQDGDMWQNLYSSPYLSEIWQNAYPQYKNYIEDFARSEEAGFVPNPGNSNVTGNIIVDKKKSVGSISEPAQQFSNIEGNAVFSINQLSKVFTDAENGNYTLREDSAAYKTIPDFKNIPFAEIGRR